ncbi:MAG: transporter substrate-binding domain-containing protein [Hyphomicrobiales bacterium]|nr:transporter substrate-binding domain-containing protein [Hyphomicrobiales bacterium]
MLLRRFALVLAFFGAMASPPAFAQTIQELVKAGTVKIGVISGAPPFGTVNEKGETVGYDVDVANLLGKYLGVKVEIVPLTAPARIPSLESRKADILVATLAPTPERAKAVMFSMPYSAFQMGIVAPKTTEIKDLKALGGKKVGVPRGGTQDVALTRMNIPGVTIVRFDDDATATQAMIAGQVDATATPNTIANELMKQRPEANLQLKFVFSQQPNSIAVRKDAFELKQWINNFLYYVKLDGELDEIHRKWIGSPLPELPVF